jgi:hypothetical protein
MKGIFSRIFAILSLSILLSLPGHAENLQLIMPKIIYIGDTVEIRYIFHSEAKIFGGDFSESASTFLNLNTEYEFFKANAADFTVTKTTLEKQNAEYTLTLTIHPWKTGFLQIPPFNLTSLVNSSLDFSRIREKHTMAITFTPFIIDLSPIEIKSLVEKTGSHNFQPQVTPLTLPGTTAFLVILAIIAFILFASILFALLHLPKIARFLSNLSYLYSLKKNSRRTIKKIRQLQRKSSAIVTDKDFAEKLQHIMRDFLNKRFDTDFSSIVTSKIYSEFSELCGGTMSEHQENTVESLFSIFARLDYVRFAENGSFLKENESNSENERITITENAVHLVEDFDTGEEE